MTHKSDTSVSILDAATLVKQSQETAPTPIDALAMAEHIQLACASVGFDWPNAKPVFTKVHEELEEVKEAIANPHKDQTDIQEELGDLLFACVNLCRHLDVNPHKALTGANDKFTQRFQKIESILNEQGQSVTSQSLSELEVLWQQVKKQAN